VSKISAYAALATGLPDDLALTVDVHDTTMAASGTDKKITLAALLTGSQVFNIVAYGADPAGVANSTAAITAAKTAAGAGTRNIILVPPGTYLTDPFTLGGFHWLGYGPYSSVIKANAGSLDFVTNTSYANGSVTTGGQETCTVVEGICFDGANLTGTNAGNLYGSTYAGPVTGLTSGTPCVVAVGNGAPGGTYGAGIPSFIFKDLVVRNGPGVGISTAYNRGGLPDSYYENIFVHDNGQSGNGHGWHHGSDCQLVSCTSENNQGAGFFNSGSSSFTVTGCKAYSALGSNGYGFWCEGQSSGAMYAGCASQDNNVGGVYFHNAWGFVVAGFLSDSDGPNAPGGIGATFAGSQQNMISYTAIDRYYTNLSKLTYALKIDTASVQNIIECAALYKWAGSQAQSWFATGSGNGAGNDIRLGNCRGITAPAYAATITPDPTAGGTWNIGALTGAVTIAAPVASSSWAGARLTFLLTQDGTGGRAVSWNAVYKFQAAWTNTGNTAGKQSYASFVFDGTSWVSLSPAANTWF